MRPDLDLLAGLVDAGSHVLDLGCGDGALLGRLIGGHRCTGYGIERSSEGFHACLARGVPVIQGELEPELERIGDGVFDLAILSLTLQATERPAFVLGEMRRIARRAIVFLRNLGHWHHRGAPAVRGRMPLGGSLPYAWHETPNIHPCTLRDFEDLARGLDVRVIRRLLLSRGGRVARVAAGWRPNLLATAAVYLLEPSSRPAPGP